MQICFQHATSYLTLWGHTHVLVRADLVVTIRRDAGETR